MSRMLKLTRYSNNEYVLINPTCVAFIEQAERSTARIYMHNIGTVHVLESVSDIEKMLTTASSETDKRTPQIVNSGTGKTIL